MCVYIYISSESFTEVLNLTTDNATKEGFNKFQIFIILLQLL